MPQLDFISLYVQYWILVVQLLILYCWSAYALLPLIYRDMYLRRVYVSTLEKKVNFNFNIPKEARLILEAPARGSVSSIYLLDTMMSWGLVNSFLLKFSFPHRVMYNFAVIVINIYLFVFIKWLSFYKMVLI